MTKLGFGVAFFVAVFVCTMQINKSVVVGVRFSGFNSKAIVVDRGD